MGKGWREVARLGGTGARFPHVLVDPHGWCLRVGPNRRADEKYYSSLPTLLHGLVEHTARRRLLALSSVLDLKELHHEVQDALHSALALGEELLERGGREELVRRLEARRAPGKPSAPSGAVVASQSGGQAINGPLDRRQAV